MNIYITAVVKSSPEFVADVEQVLRTMVTETRKEAACLKYELQQGLDDKTVFVFNEIWADQQGLDLHHQQSYIKDFLELIPTKLQEAPVIYRLSKVE